jgi:hypothetical protein
VIPVALNLFSLAWGWEEVDRGHKTRVTTINRGENNPTVAKDLLDRTS